MRRHVLCALVLTAIGCSGAVDGTPQQQQKLAAANAHAQGTQTGDACAQNRWYGDGECDTFCADTDSDCVPSGKAVVCAQFIEGGNGVCDRPANDACRFQDPDCSAPPSTPGAGGSSGSAPPGGVACALVSEVPNNHCDRPASDPCRFQDPDCNAGGPVPTPVDCDTSKVVCQTFAPVVCPAGQVPTVVNGCYGPCVDEQVCTGKGTGGGSGAGGEPNVGGGSAGTAGSPGSGGASSAGGAPSSSGGSTGTAGSPGSSGGQGTMLYDCDPRKITCQTLVAVTCPAGQVPTVLNNCYGMCVPKDQCEPIACAAYIEISDSVCSRPENDPCRGQDPDCAPGAVVCAQYIEASDGVCSRPADDPCSFQDPDCKKP